MTGSGDVFDFGAFRLDLRRMGVWKGAERVLVEPRALDVLRYLVLNRDRLVTKDELLDAVWKDTFVTPNALTRAVAQLRKALGDDVGSPTLIETVARRGYRFVAPVTTGSAAAASGQAGVDPAVVPLHGRPWTASARRLTAAAALVGLLAGAGWIAARSRSAPPAAPALQITPLTAYGDVIDAIVSPDAKYLAFIRSSGARQSLWVRQLHGTNPIELVGPQPVNYYGMSFAPDGASIYYVLRGPAPLAEPAGMLFQIPSLGGAPRRLGVPFDHYPAVSPDGRLVASLRSRYPEAGQSALVCVNADGSGMRTLLAVREPDILAPGFFIAPAWSPSGDRIAVALRNTDSRTAHLVTVDVATGAARTLSTPLSSAQFTAWMPDGSGIVFTGAVRRKASMEFGSDLWFQPLPDGPPRPITTGVVEYRNASVSADGSALVSVGGLQNAGLWRVPLAGGRVERVPSQKEDGLAGLAWLDDGAVVFTSFDGGTPQIWRMDADGGRRRQLTTEGLNFAPRATRDGRTVFFAAARDGGSGIWRMDGTGTGQRLVVRAPELWDLVLTPDERRLFYTAPGSDRLDSTWTVGIDGGDPALVVNGLTHAAPSPDGRFVAGFWQASANSQPVLAVFPMTGGAPLHVFDRRVAPDYGGVWWSRDEAALFYTTADRTNLWRQPLNGGLPAAVTDFTDRLINRGDLSPDGQTLLVVRGNPLRDAFLITGFR